jgi:hypothetical protein
MNVTGIKTLTISQNPSIYTFLIFPGNLGMYDSWLFEQVADIPLQVQDGLGHSICMSMLLLERPKRTHTKVLNSSKVNKPVK